jgi:hypothetical protein
MFRDQQEATKLQVGQNTKEERPIDLKEVLAFMASY